MVQAPLEHAQQKEHQAEESRRQQEEFLAQNNLLTDREDPKRQHTSC